MSFKSQLIITDYVLSAGRWNKPVFFFLSTRKFFYRQETAYRELHTSDCPWYKKAGHLRETYFSLLPHTVVSDLYPSAAARLIDECGVLRFGDGGWNLLDELTKDLFDASKESARFSSVNHQK